MIKKFNLEFGFFIIGILLVLNLGIVLGADSFSTTNAQFSEPSFQSFYSSQGIDYTQFWPMLKNSDNCEARYDFIVNIRPGSCMPAVVRSDLLEEQNVPVFCQLDAVKLNPLISVGSISSVRFKGDYPANIAGVSFHPSDAALRIYDSVLESPLINNVGYVVVLLKKQESEKTMPDMVEANLTAIMRYDMKNVFGAGQSSYYVPVLNLEDWQNDLYKDYGFWKGKGYIKVDWIEDNKAGIAIYKDKNNVLRTLTLEKGQTSSLIYMPGFYCSGGVQVQLSNIGIGQERAKIQIDDEEKWVIRGEKILDNNCVVKEISSFGGYQSITLTCRGKDISLSLGISESVVLQKNGNSEIQANLGEKVLDTSDSNIYVAYIGKAKKDSTKTDEKEQLFTILIQNPNIAKITTDGKLKSEDINFIAKNIDSWKRVKNAGSIKWYQEGSEVVKNIKNMFGKDAQVNILFKGKDEKEGSLNYKLVELAELKDTTCDTFAGTDTLKKTNCEKLDEYFSQAEKTAQELVSGYGNEQNAVGEYYGAEALWNIAELAGKLQKYKTQSELLAQINEKYSGSYYSTQAEEKLKQLSVNNFKNSETVISTGNAANYVKLISAVKPGEDDASANFNIQGDKSVNVKKTLLIGESIFIDGKTDETKEEHLVLKEIKDSSVVVDYYFSSSSTSTTTAGPGTASTTTTGLKRESRELKKGESLSIEGQRVALEDIKLKKIAEIKIISQIPNGETEANFSVRIGIEKRGIELSPDKALDMIENINKSIKKWEDINEKLGNVVSAWKGACLATSAGLFVKNLVTGMNGASMARQMVMRNSGGWYDQCNKEIAEGQHSGSMDKCLSVHNKEIENSVDTVSSKINDMNSKLETINNANTKSTSFGEEFNSKKATEDMRDEFKKFKNANAGVKVNINGQERTLGSLDDNQVDALVKNGDLSINQMRDIMLYGSLANDANIGTRTMATRNLETQLNPVFEAAEIESVRISMDPGIQKNLGANAYINNIPGAKGQDVYVRTVTVPAEGKNYNSIQIPAGKYTLVNVPANVNVKDSSAGNLGGSVLLIPLAASGNSLNPNYDGKTYKIASDGTTATEVNKDNVQKVISQSGIRSFKELSNQMCNNQYISPKVKFYQTGLLKGKPAVVPVNVEKGWYAATKSVSGVIGLDASPFDSSGAVTSLWLCNVGSNGREEWNSGGDDTPCTKIDYTTGQPLNQLYCLSDSEAITMAKKAKKVIEQASAQYGKNKISLDSGNFDVDNAASVDGTQCYDFMSPQDCNTMFNVCDPVMCPTSRCDFGGKYPVDDVVQSGIIGSILLCLPNFGSPSQGGVIVPVCLSGIHAGIEGWVSIMKAHRDCLAENVNSGKYIGICDEIYSIYVCEFFWRQAAPLLKTGVTSLFNFFSTGRLSRGGGEYLTVNHAWENMQKSVDYFTNTYAVNAFDAFKARSTGEIGTEICKAFISTNYPNDIDTLLEPESPVQFHAWFNEIPYTDATVPATSQYKVYYHIFAGNDAGHYFQVYLKDPPSTGYYSQQEIIIIDSGFVGVGQNIDQAKDFTAPEKYKSLCVKIDSKEECGFGKVSTSFALNELSDLYVNEQGSDSVSSESECVSGSPSAIPLVQPNIQEGVYSGTVGTAAYKSGLIRICSSDNPGDKTNANRWKSVGYCDSVKKIKCWLDTESVKNAIKDSGLEKDTLTNAQEIMNSQIEGANKPRTEKETNDLLVAAEKKLEKEIIFNGGLANSFFSSTFKADKLNEQTDNTGEIGNIAKLIVSLKDIEKRGFFNSHKAKAYFLETAVYNKIAKQMGMTLSLIPKEATSSVGEISAQEKIGVENSYTNMEIDSAALGFSDGSSKNLDNAEINIDKYPTIFRVRITKPENKELNKNGVVVKLQEESTNLVNSYFKYQYEEKSYLLEYSLNLDKKKTEFNIIVSCNSCDGINNKEYKFTVNFAYSA